MQFLLTDIVSPADINMGLSVYILFLSNILKPEHRFVTRFVYVALAKKRFIDNPRQFRDWLDTTWAKEYIRGEHLKNILEKDREPIDWNYRKFVAKKVYEDKMGILIARAKDL